MNVTNLKVLRVVGRYHLDHLSKLELFFCVSSIKLHFSLRSESSTTKINQDCCVWANRASVPFETKGAFD